jgi:hypothetical protein
VERNPLDTNPPHGVAGFGPAPGAAQAGDSGGATTTDQPAWGEWPDAGGVNSGAGAKRAIAAPARDQDSPWRGLLGAVAVCAVLVGIVAAAATRLNRR